MKKMKSAHIGKCAVLFLLSGFWLLTTINGSYRDFSFIDKILIFSLSALICGSQIAFLSMVTRIEFLTRGYNIFFAIFAVVNLFCLYLFFIVSFAALPTFTQAALFLFSLFIAHQFFASLSIGGGWWTKGVVGVTSVLFLVNIAWFVKQSYPDKEPPPILAEGKTSSPKIKIVDFQQKPPNVYFISFDAMIPESLAEKHLQITELPYQRFMIKNGFRRFRNAFSDGFSTRFSLNQLLAMEYDYFETLTKQNKHLDLFTGMSPSPALEIFKANGYITNTYFHDQYMGHQVGPYVNNHQVAYRINYFSFCRNHLAVNASIFGFFGYCLISENERVRNFIFNINISDMERLGTFQYVDFVLKDFARQLSIGKPFVSFMHIASPNHTPLTYNQNQFSSYRKVFLLHSVNETPSLMKKIFNFIQVNDPNAFIYFYSDHGQWLSRWLNSNGFQQMGKEDKEFYIQDRYGILAAFYPPDSCAEYFDDPMMKQFVTNTKVLRQIIRCLANGDDPITTPVEYRLWPYEDGYQGDEPGYFEDYLYE